MNQANPLNLDTRRALQLARLAPLGQEHILHFWEQLDSDARDRLLLQCEALPLDLLAPEMAALRKGDRPADVSHGAIEPADVVPHAPCDAGHYRAIGEKMIREGRVACFTVAGGQGTRLGWDGPKGTFPASPVTHRSLFELFALSIRAARKKWSATIRWYIMTSPLNHQETTEYFVRNNWFNLGESTVRLFMQGTMPSLGMDGRILMSSPETIALNPDGHGGAVRALASSGSLDEMKRDSIDTMSYFQVDNPLVHVVDPLFLGLHRAHPSSSGEVSSKVVSKRDAHEKVGVFCKRDGRTQVLEYSDLPAQLASATAPDGTLLHRAGSIAIHAFSREFLEKLACGGGQLPLHRANKKVPCIDPETGEAIEPNTPNAIKLEAFIFDSVPLARSSMVYETIRSEEFAPIKNAQGEDSPLSSQQAQSDRAARWLAGHGVVIEPGSESMAGPTIEISPLTALEASDLSRTPHLPSFIAAGTSTSL